MKQIMCFIFLSFWMMTSAQSTLFDSTLVMENESGQTEIPFEVPSKADHIGISFDGLVSHGSIEVELIDPDGQRQGGFQLNTSSDDYVMTRHSKHGDQDATSTRSVIRSSGSSMTVETTTSEGSDDNSKSKSKSKSKAKSNSNSNSNSNANSNSNGNSTSTSTSTSSSGSGKNVTTTISTSTSNSGQNISIKSGDGETISISSADGNSEVHSKNGDHHGSSEAKGRMIESISDPDPGTWRIIMKAEDATGRLKIEVEQD